MAAENPTWGEEHIANELKLKLGIRVSPRTVRKYLADYRGRTLIGVGERHLRQVLTNRVAHYNHARVHTSLGPRVPDSIRPTPPMSDHRHHLPAGHVLRSKAVLGGLHHEYLAGEGGGVRLESGFCGPLAT